MLSKLRHHGAAACSAMRAGNMDLTSGLRDALGAELHELHPLSGGTLGICFTGKLRGKERFFKTQAVPEGHFTLEREVVFLAATGADRVDPQLLSVGDGATRRTWLHMKMLMPCSPLTPTDARALISGYEAALKSSNAFEKVPRTDSLRMLLSEAAAAIQVLAEKGLISTDVQRAVSSRVDRLRSISGAWPLQVCHGDLGPRNILSDGFAPIAVDWEDGFWGVAGYDYLYWLTFFANRKWLSRKALGHTPLGRANEIAMMIAILLLKSLLSVRDGNYLRNTISFDQRLLEVIELDG